MRKGLEAFCIFLGRCAGEILKDETPLLQVFIYADDIKQKIRRIVELDGVPERDAQSSLHRKDAERKNYYHYFTCFIFLYIMKEVVYTNKK